MFKIENKAFYAATGKMNRVGDFVISYSPALLNGII